MDENQEPEKSKEEILKQFTQNEKGKYVHTLKVPFSIGKEEKTEFVLDIPKAKHLRRMPAKPSMDSVLKMIASLANEPDTTVDELSFEDMNILSEYVQAFS